MLPPPCVRVENSATCMIKTQKKHIPTHALSTDGPLGRAAWARAWGARRAAQPPAAAHAHNNNSINTVETGVCGVAAVCTSRMCARRFARAASANLSCRVSAVFDGRLGVRSSRQASLRAAARPKSTHPLWLARMHASFVREVEKQYDGSAFSRLHASFATMRPIARRVEATPLLVCCRAASGLYTRCNEHGMVRHEARVHERHRTLKVEGRLRGCAVAAAWAQVAHLPDRDRALACAREEAAV